MKITVIGTVPPASAPDAPRVTPELLASCLARYSRSDKGIEAILGQVDPADPDASVERIFKFVDYGHASISGLTGGIAVAVDRCSLLLIYKIFEIARLSDGQESSTRYIHLDESGLADPEVFGLPDGLASRWREVALEGIAEYRRVAGLLDGDAVRDPRLVRAPEGAGEKVMARMRRNYALDRARYLLPASLLNNAAFVMTARVWAETIKTLDAHDLPEFRECASGLRRELSTFVPRLMRHSHRDEASVRRVAEDGRRYAAAVAAAGCPTENLADAVRVRVHDDLPVDLLPPLPDTLDDAFGGKTNRYSAVGERVCRAMVRYVWNNVAFAELRDLNRHRSGHRCSPLTPAGFYSPPGVDRGPLLPFLGRYAGLVADVSAADTSAAGLARYCHLLGTQSPFEHSTHLDKFIYEVELRTGLGAHFRYAEHLRAALAAFLAERPEYAPYVEVGTAEPE